VTSAGRAADLSTHPGHLLRRMQQVHTMLWTTMVSEDITSPQFAVLNGLAERPDADQRTLGALTSLDRSTTADVVRRLADRGLITRVRDGADARRNVLRLTEEGAALHRKLVSRTNRMNEVLLAPLHGPQRDDLLALMHQVALAGERLRQG
jgi:DNA-binding MarR family transcriptional regulator